MAKMQDKTYTLSEANDGKQLFFYRNDGNVLEGNDFQEEVTKLFEAYIACKLINGERVKLLKGINFEFVLKMSKDRKNIKLTFNKQPNFFKQLIKKIWG